MPKKPLIDVMLDSGAFTAWTKNESINIKEYTAYIKANQTSIGTYLNLDVIPGKAGQPRSPDDYEAAAKASYKNLRMMKKAGLCPIPVFHQQESFKWLRQMIKDKEQYIALSTFKELTIRQNREWLDECFTELTNPDGKPICKIHGLGIASFDLWRRYPWYSCDASSWALTAAFGAVLCPIYTRGQPDYSFNPVKVVVTHIRSKMPHDHFLKMPRIIQERVRSYLKELGLSIDDCASEEGKEGIEDKAYVNRARAIRHFYKKMEASIQDVPFRYRIRSFNHR